MRRKTYLDVELSRERRLWFKEIRSVVVPLVVTGSYVFSKKENREAVKNITRKIKNKVKSFFEEE